MSDATTMVLAILGFLIAVSIPVMVIMIIVRIMGAMGKSTWRSLKK